MAKSRTYENRMGSRTKETRDGNLTTRRSFLSGSRFHLSNGLTHEIATRKKEGGLTRYTSTSFSGDNSTTRSVAVNSSKTRKQVEKQLMDLREKARGTAHEARVKEMDRAYGSWSGAAPALSAG